MGYQEIGIEEWLIRTVQVMYRNEKSSVRISGRYSPWFDVQVGVHQCSVLNSILFTIAIEALSCLFRTGCSWELLFADDLIIIAETLVELLEKFRV